MEDEDVLEIAGVGIDTAANLRDNGFDTVGDVAAATVDEVSAVDGFGATKAEEAIENATELVSGGSDDSDGSDGESDTDLEAESDDDVNEDDADPTYPVEFDVDRDVGYHIIHVVLEEATAQHQSNSFSLRADAYDVSSKLMDAFTDSEGAEFEPSLDLTQRELNAFYRALNQGALDYNGRSGVTGMYGTLNSVKDIVNEQRKIARRS